MSFKVEFPYFVVKLRLHVRYPFLSSKERLQHGSHVARITSDLTLSSSSSSSSSSSKLWNPWVFCLWILLRPRPWWLPPPPVLLPPCCWHHPSRPRRRRCDRPPYKGKGKGRSHWRIGRFGRNGARLRWPWIWGILPWIWGIVPGRAFSG